MLNKNINIVRKKNIVSSSLDGEIILMSLNNSSYYGLNLTASRIWDLIEEPCNVNDIINILVSEYDVSFEKCDFEVNQIIQDFSKNSLIEINK
jgi:hypothetical protein